MGKKIPVILLIMILVLILLTSGQKERSLAGKRLDFETVDIDGDPVSSGELFAQHEITMLNLWATWCGPCISELNELNTVNDELQKFGGTVVGLLNDGKGDADAETGKCLLAENEAAYLNILAPANLNEQIRQNVYPMTVFVDREGTIIGKTLYGTVEKEAIVDYYVNAAREALKDNE